MIAPPVSAGDHFIFYGLLKQGSVGMPRGLDLERHGEFLGPCRFRARMFDLGSYPGVVRRGGISQGVLYRLDHDPRRVANAPTAIANHPGATYPTSWVAAAAPADALPINAATAFMQQQYKAAAAATGAVWVCARLILAPM